jgi:hypothetical protein
MFFPASRRNDLLADPADCAASSVRSRAVNYSAETTDTPGTSLTCFQHTGDLGERFHFEQIASLAPSFSICVIQLAAYGGFVWIKTAKLKSSTERGTGGSH